MPEQIRAPRSSLRRLALPLAAAALAAGPAGAAYRAPVPQVGAYRLADGGLVSLVVSERRLRLVDYRSGAYRSLREESAGAYVGGPGASVTSPVRVHVRAAPGGRIVVDGRLARRVPLVSQPAVFRDGPIRLVGRLLRPPGGGRRPAVVIVPGAERARRTTYDLWAYFLAAHGFAVLTYDRRGVGDSDGTYERRAATPNLERLAADALAGLAWLRGRPNVDPRRLGLVGASQAGWVVEIAATRSPDVRFAALQSAPAMSVGRQLAYARVTGQGWRDPPPSEQEIAGALAEVPDTGFDPRRAIASLRIPVLWQMGSVDKRMYTPETLADLKAIDAEGRHDFTVRLYAGGAHSLRRTADGLIREERTSPGFVPAVFRDLAAWLRRVTGR